MTPSTAMGNTDLLTMFWTSVLGAEFEDKLSDVMKVKDPEERIIQLLLRMLFILTLEIKKEKDDAVDTNKKLEEKINIRLKEIENTSNIIEKSKKQVDSNIKKKTCLTNCKKLTFGDDMQITDESDDDIVPNTEMEKVNNEIENMATTRRGKRNRNLEANNTQDLHKKARKELESDSESTDSTQHKNIRANRSYRILSRSSPRKKNYDKNDKNKVLAPETQFLNENAFYFDVSSRQALATQTVSVPETMVMTQYPDAPSDNYDNTDFYDARSTIDSETQIDDIDNDKVIENQQKTKPGVLLHVKADALLSLESPLKQNLATPAAESQKLPSPVLGKVSKGNTSNSHRSSAKKITSPKKSTPSKKTASPKKSTPSKKTTSPKEPLKQVQINTPSQALSPSYKYSPLTFKGDVNSSMNDSDLGSPSLLPWVNLRNQPIKKNEMENIAELAMASQPTEFCKPETMLYKRSSLLRKTKSSFDASTPKISSDSTFRSKRSSVKQAKIGEYEMTVEPPQSPESRKNFKQTKITAQAFAPKTTDLAKLTGGVLSKLKENGDDAIELKKAIDESLKTKEVEDLMRKNKKMLNMMSEEKVESIDIHTTDYKGPGPFSSPKNVRKTLHSPEKLRRSPRKSQRSPQNNPMSPKKMTKNPMKAAAIQKDLNTKGGSPAEMKQDECSEEQQMGLEEMLEAVSSPEFKIPQKKSKLKRKQVENSFDVFSVKMEDPGFAYKNDVVRKQSDRKKMSGWACKQCEAYYNNQHLTDKERQIKMDACSRHRSKYKPITNTPPGFWNATFSSSDDEQ